MNKVPCEKCGREIQEATAKRNNGLCQPCGQGMLWKTCTECGKEFRIDDDRSVCFDCLPPLSKPLAGVPAEMIVDVILKCLATETSEEMTLQNLNKLGLAEEEAKRAIAEVQEGFEHGISVADIESETGFSVRTYENDTGSYFELAKQRGNASVQRPKRWWQFWR